MKTFTYLKDLRPWLAPTMINDLLTQHLVGDPDWLHDIIQELDYINPKNPCYVKGFHDALIRFKSKDFDFQTLCADIEDTLNSRPMLRKRLANAYIAKHPEYHDAFTKDCQMDPNWEPK